MTNVDRERWETTLAQDYVFRPRWWSKNGRSYGPPGSVMLGKRHLAGTWAGSSAATRIAGKRRSWCPRKGR